MFGTPSLRLKTTIPSNPPPPFHYCFSCGYSILEICCEKSCGPPTSQNGLMHDPSQIPTQKHLTLPSPPPRQKIIGSENNSPEVLLI